MPRAIDVNPQNLQVDHNPTVKLDMSAGQVSNFLTNLPAEIEQALKAALNTFLTELDDETGLNFLGWATALENLLSGSGGSTSGDLLADFTTWLSGVNINAGQALQNWITTFDNLEQSTIDDLTAYWAEAKSDSSQAWTEIQNFLTTGDWSDLKSAWQDLLQGIFGSATTPGLLGSVPSSAVSNVNQNLQPASDFPSIAALSPGGGWSQDSTTSYGGSGGSAKFSCSGVLGALRGVVSPVQPGQIVTPSAQVEWSGLSAVSGTHPIQLQLIPYSGPTDALVAGTPFVIAQITSPASSASWAPLTGSYTIPSSGVTAVQMRLVVTADATAGTVWWADCTDDVTGGFLSVMQDDLSTLQSDNTAKQAALQTFIQAVETAISSGGGWSTEASAIDSAWQTYQTTVTALNNSQVFTIRSFLNSLLGVNTSTGLIGSGSVQSSTGAGTLQADWNQLGTNLQNTWNSLFGSTSAPATGSQTISQQVVSGLTDVWNWLTGTHTPTSSTQVQASAVASVTGASSLGSDVTSAHGAAAAAATNAQAITDAVANAVGVTGTGNPASSVATPLAKALGPSQFHAYCTTAAAGATASTTTGTITMATAGMLFDTVDYQTSDLTWTASTNTITVSTKGLYMVRIQFAAVLSTGSSVGTVTPILQQNGTAVRGGAGLTGAAQAAASGTLDVFVALECNAGDTLTPAVTQALNGRNVKYGGNNLSTSYEVTLVRADP